MKPVKFAVLPHIIRKGRRQAHEELSELFGDGDEVGATEFAQRDPSLFTEPLDSRVASPLSYARRAGYVPGRGTTFTWAMVAAESSMADLVDVLLVAGVHPCDPNVFMKVPLLSHSEWFFRPKNCARVLKLGADPDSPMDADREWLSLGTSTVGQWLVKRLVGGLAAAPYATECLHLLIAAGAKVLSPEPGRDVAFLLARAPSGYSSADPSIDERLKASATLMHALARAGHPIDRPDCQTCTTPIKEAVRAKNRPMVEALIEAGANTKDVVSAAGLFVDEVELSFGVDGRAWFIEAVMRAEIVRRPVGAVPSTDPRPRGLRQPV